MEMGAWGEWPEKRTDAHAQRQRRMELTRTLRITNELGLHARSAAKIVELSAQFEARLYLSKDEQEVDGGSILSILTLACPKGTTITVRIVGNDAEPFMKTLCCLFNEKFGETS